MNDTIYFQTKAFSEIKEADNNEVIIEGFASTKDIDRYQDIVEPKAFKNAIDGFMKNPIMLLQHNQDKPIGKFTEANITSKGLKVKGVITNDIDNIKENIKNGVIKGFSIGFIVKAWKFDTKDGLEVRVITDLELLEISAVAVPANPFTLFQAVKKYFTTINEKSMEDTTKIEDEILDEEQKEIAPAVEQSGDDTEEVKEEEKVEEVKEEVEEKEEEVKDAGEAHELHNEKSSDDSENSDETPEGSKETETEETEGNKSEETVEEEKDGETAENDVDLKSAVKELMEIVAKQSEIIEKQQSTIASVGLKKGLATISTNETKSKDSGNNAWLKTFQTAKKNINY